MSTILRSAAILLLLAGAAAAQASSVEIKDVWARATPGGAENGGAYLTIESNIADRLTGVTTPVAQKAELHMMKMQGGVMTMSPLTGIDLPPGQPVTLKPGATHIMLLGLKHPLRAGESIPLTLQFEKSGTREVTANVAKIGAMAPEQHSGGMHMPMPANR